MEKKENKFISIKSDDFNAKEMTFSGYGAYFGNIDSYGDIIAKGAFQDAITEIAKTGNYPAMLSQHGLDSYTPVGIYTLIKEDEKGLDVEGKLADTQEGRDLYALMKMTPRPAIKGLSIGFRVTEAEYPKGIKGCERIIKSVDLMEISIVTFPANEKATITNVKSEIDVREAETSLKEAGYSAKEAKTIISIIKRKEKQESEVEETTITSDTPIDMLPDNPDMDDTPDTEDTNGCGGGPRKKKVVKSVEDSVLDDLKSFVEYVKSRDNPFTDDEEKSLRTWINEEKKEDELREILKILK